LVISKLEQNVYSEKIFIKGIIKSIGTTGSYLKNVVITDETDSTKEILIFSVNFTAGVVESVKIGDTVTVNGYLVNYYGTYEVSSNNGDYAYFTACTPHTCDMSDATCDAPATCSICGTTNGEALGHTEANAEGNCDRCGTNLEAAAKVEKVSTTIAAYATANGWTNEGKYTEFKIDENVTVSCAGSDANTGKHYTSGGDWRLYQTGSATLTISVPEGYEIVSVKISYVSNKNGCLTYNGANISTDQLVEVGSQSITLAVGNTGTATNGQARVTSIEVEYRAIA
jgi:hypothetical protein